jgi:hypothetical protein
MRHIVVKGTNYECGLQLGRRLRKEIQENIDQRGFDLEARSKELKQIHSACVRRFPQYVQELQGIADGAGVDYEALLLLNSPAHREHGCSGIAINTAEQTLIAHNEDESKKLYRKGMFALVTMITKDTTITAFYYPGEILGTAYGWNSHGMYFSGNRLFPKPRPSEKIPLYFAVRAVYDARTIKEAARIIHATSHGSGWHYFIAKGRRIVSIEQLYGRMSLVEVKGRYCHTNHFIHKRFEKVLSPDASTKPRLKRMREMKEQDPIDVLFDSENAPCAIYNDEDDLDITLSTVLLDVRKKEVTIYASKSRKSSLKGY